LLETSLFLGVIATSLLLIWQRLQHWWGCQVYLHCSCSES